MKIFKTDIFARAIRTLESEESLHQGKKILFLYNFLNSVKWASDENAKSFIKKFGRYYAHRDNVLFIANCLNSFDDLVLLFKGRLSAYQIDEFAYELRLLKHFSMDLNKIFSISSDEVAALENTFLDQKLNDFYKLTQTYRLNGGDTATFYVDRKCFNATDIKAMLLDPFAPIKYFSVKIKDLNCEVLKYNIRFNGNYYDVSSGYGVRFISNSDFEKVISAAFIQGFIDKMNQVNDSNLLKKYFAGK